MSDLDIAGSSNRGSVVEENRRESKELDVAVGNKEADDGNDVAKDEKKDSEKPLLDRDHDTIEIDIEPESKGKDVDSPTLPLPERISKRDQDPPPVFPFPLARVKYAWETSDTVLEFVTRAICILFASLGWLVVVGGFPLISIVELIIGSIYLHDCPAQPMIPEYLIVAGVFGSVLHVTAVCTKAARKKRDPRFETSRKFCLSIETVLQIFLFAWFISGCFWVYGIYEPEYKIWAHPNYCHKTLYLFTFWLFNINFFLIIIMITLCICCISFVAIGSQKSKE